MEKGTRYFYKLSLLLIAVLFSGSIAFSQRTIQGKVADANDNTPLIGVTVQVKGTTTGVITDFNGDYEIQVPDEDGVVLLYSFIGYLDQEVTVGTSSVINIQLEPSIEEIEEIVVVGYGTQKKSDLTGSVSVVSTDDIMRANAATLQRAIQGKGTGIQVTQGSGAAGGGADVKIRGVGSISSGTGPLYVIDGVNAGSDDFNSLSPNEIKSVQVLKDASASAIYGARGANGVIIVETLKGSRNKPVSANLQVYTGIMQIPQTYDVMNADQYSEVMLKSWENYFIDHPESKTNFPVAFTDSMRQKNNAADTDWQDLLLQQGTEQNYALTISGGSENSNFSISGSYYTAEGTTVGDFYERIKLRAASDFSVNDWLSFGETMIIKRQNNTPKTANLYMAATTSPYMHPYNDDVPGGWGGPLDSVMGGNETTNPLYLLEGTEKDITTNNVFGTVYSSIKPIKGLEYKIQLGLKYSSKNTRTYSPEAIIGNFGNRSNYTSDLDHASNEFKNITLDNIISYNNSIGEHSFSLMGAYAMDLRNSYSYSVTTEEVDPNLQTLRNADKLSGASEYISEDNMLSYLGRVNYDYAGKYLATFNLRRDGSSRFGPGKKWGLFPSFSLGWKMNEDLLKSVDEINMLKLRVGYGATGNQNIPNYAYEEYIEPGQDHARWVVEGDQMLTGLMSIRSHGNPLVQWESTNMLNFGADLSAFDNKIEASAEYYIKSQKNLLVKHEISYLFGKNPKEASPWVNLGELRNTGLELMVIYKKYEGAFNYKINANLTTIKNEVIDIPEDISNGPTRTAVGLPVGSFYGYVAEGIFQDTMEITNHAIQSGAKPGDLKFKDLNGDGRIDSDDRTYIGSPIPDALFGVGFDCSYKGFDFAVFLQGLWGSQAYNSMASTVNNGTDVRGKDLNKLTSVLDHWTPENHSTTNIRLSSTDDNNNGLISTWWIENNSYMRLKTVQLGYTLPSNLTSKVGLKKVRVYLSGNNLLTLTKYSGIDPELPNGSVLSSNVDSGNIYPPSRSYIAGIEVKF